MTKPPQDIKTIRSHVADYLDRFYQDLYKNDIHWVDEYDQVDRKLFDDVPSGSANVIRDVKKRYEQLGLDLTSPHQFGYVPIGGNMVSFLTDYMLAGYHSHTHRTKDALHDAEREAMQWLCETVGYDPKKAGGYFMKGSSVATVHCLATARKVKELQPQDYENAVIYTTDRAHMCIFRAIVVNGLASCKLHNISYDDKHRMDIDALKDQIQKDKDADRNPYLLIGIMGSTDCGTVDHLNQMAEVARENGMWFHVDGAIGGGFAQVHVDQTWKDGKNLCDSMAISAHKCLGQPFALSGALFKDGENKSACFGDETGMFEGNPLCEPTTFSSLALWSTIKVFGKDFMHDHMRKNLLLVKYVYAALKDVKGLECMDPQLNIAAFRVVAQHNSKQEGNRLTKELEKKFEKDGRVIVSGCPVQDWYYIRVVSSTMTNHISGIDMCLQMIKEHTGRDVKIPSKEDFPEKEWLENFEKKFRAMDEAQKKIMLDVVRDPAKIFSGEVTEKISPELGPEGTDMLTLIKGVRDLFVDNTVHDEEEQRALEIGQLGLLIGQMLGHVPTLCELGSGTCEMTEEILKHVARKAKLPLSTLGILTGSDGMSNLLALRTAVREFVGTRIYEIADHKYVIYQHNGEIQHMASLLNILGVRGVVIKTIKDADDLREQIKVDKDNGFMPWVVFMMDYDLKDHEHSEHMANICHDENMWFHIILTKEASLFPYMKTVPYLGGIPKADSLTIDVAGPLHISMPVKCVLVRQKANLRDAVDTGLPSPYLPPKNPLAYQPYDYGIELSAPNRMFVVWFTLRILGVEFIRKLNGVGEEVEEAEGAVSGAAGLINRVRNRLPKLHVPHFH